MAKFQNLKELLPSGERSPQEQEAIARFKILERHAACLNSTSGKKELENISRLFTEAQMEVK